ncbi:MAG TPA: S-methyl-5'-thioinosine phosphorylase [Gammaproteobacteria bacterium]|nr:S-methyl-5'-thioinosine phosphorylase [Gammaproteobacteria bacterium]
MTRLAIIGGSGLTSLAHLEITKREVSRTPYGELSGPLIYGNLNGQEVVFLARHGYAHTIPPHLVNYRANLWALKEAGISHIIAVAAVGGIPEKFVPTSIVFPDQIIDYTYSRAHTIFDEDHLTVTHIDFTEPYCEELRTVLIDAATRADIAVIPEATYAATQGPRFETAAEIDRLERDGAHVVGMTGMPETVLARELGLCYATIAVVANAAAGRGAAKLDITTIEETLEQGMCRVRGLLGMAIPIAVDSLGLKG